MYIDRQPGH